MRVCTPLTQEGALNCTHFNYSQVVERERERERERRTQRQRNREIGRALYG